MPSRPSKLDRTLAAALERAGHAMAVRLREEAQRHGLSPIQVQILLRLAGDPAARRRIGVLAAELDVRGPTISDAVAALRRKGLVRDTPIVGDRRGRQLDATEAGQDLAAELVPWTDGITRRLAPVADADKQTTLAVVLDLIAGLQRDGVITVARTCTSCRFFAREARPGDAQPHHCQLLDAPLGVADLRLNCAEHELAAA